MFHVVFAIVLVLRGWEFPRVRQMTKLTPELHNHACKETVRKLETMTILTSQ